MSNTYLDWAGRNLALNGFSQKRHRLVQADCRKWLGQQKGNSYELIYLDPPTFSNSARMEGAFDVQRDHVALIHSAARLLTPDGVLFFSTNFRRFKLGQRPLEGVKGHGYKPQDIARGFQAQSPHTAVLAFREGAKGLVQLGVYAFGRF